MFQPSDFRDLSTYTTNEAEDTTCEFNLNKNPPDCSAQGHQEPVSDFTDDSSMIEKPKRTEWQLSIETGAREQVKAEMHPKSEPEEVIVGEFVIRSGGFMKGGAYSSVKSAINTFTGEEVAVKITKKNEPNACNA